LEIIYSNRKGEFPMIVLRDSRSKKHLDELHGHYQLTAYHEMCMHAMIMQRS